MFGVLESETEMRTTETNGNSVNGIRGTRLSIWNDDNELIDRFEIPLMYGHAKDYCVEHPTGKYGKRYLEAIKKLK